MHNFPLCTVVFSFQLVCSQSAKRIDERKYIFYETKFVAFLRRLECLDKSARIIRLIHDNMTRTDTILWRLLFEPFEINRAN